MSGLHHVETQRQYKKAAYVFMGFLAAYALVRGVAGAASRVFWFDEFFTLLIAGQPTVHDIWVLLKRPADTQPLLYYLIERLTLSMPVKKEVALRLPSILAFPCIAICVFEFVRRRSGELVACFCGVLLLSTSLFHTYLLEARPYTAPVACIAFALVCYQRLPSRRWAVLFAISLVLAELLHYYAILAMAGFWLAEGVTWLTTKQFRRAVWLALFLGVLPLIPALPLLSATKAFYGQHIWSLPNLSRVFGYYGMFFAVDRVTGLALLALSITAILWQTVQARPRADDSGLDVAQAALLLWLNLLPFIAYALTRIAHGGLTDRYVLAAILGIVLGISCALSVIRSNGAVAFLAVFFLTSVGMHERQFWRMSWFDVLADDHYFSIQSRAQLEGIQRLVQSGGHFDLPVVFDENMAYAQVVYYSSPDWTSRLVFLTDEEREYEVEGTDSGVRVLKDLGNLYPLRLMDYTGFTRQHSDFLVYAHPKGWMLTSMLREGASAQIVSVDGGRVLYLVSMKQSDAPK